MRTEEALLKSSTCWVVKIGSALITNDGEGLDKAAIQDWVAQIAALRAQGMKVVLVSSGSIAEGMARLGWLDRPQEIFKLQAAAAIGQMGLVQTYEASFQAHNLQTAQVLLTHEDHADRQRYLNARSTLRTLLDLDVIPVVNENDTVATNEIRFGDNDTLGALVAQLVEADGLIILTDQQGLYTADPRKDKSAQLISQGRASDNSLVAMAGEGGKLGRGGMQTKVKAAQLAACSGAYTLIASGREKDVLLRAKQGEDLGTLLLPEQQPSAARKQWIAAHQSSGRLRLDAGASKALAEQGKSLLSAGVVDVSGDFSRGEVVLIEDDKGQVIARGLVNYSADDSRKIIGKASSEIESILGFLTEPELIHRDNIAFIAS